MSSLAEGISVAQNAPQSTSGVGLNRSTLKTGSQGNEVSELQAALKLLGYYLGKVDGVYTDSTAIAVSKFQQAAGLTPDGVVGAETWNRLFPATPTTATRVTPSASPPTTSAASFPVPATNRTVSPSSSPQATPPTNFRITNRSAATSSNSQTPTRSTTTSSNSRTPIRSTTTSSNSNTSTRQVTRRSTSQTSSENNSSSQTLPILRLGTQGSSVTRLQRRLRNLGYYSGAINGVFDTSTQRAVQAAQGRFKLEQDGVVGPATWEVLQR